MARQQNVGDKNTDDHETKKFTNHPYSKQRQAVDAIMERYADQIVENFNENERQKPGNRINHDSDGKKRRVKPAGRRRAEPDVSKIPTPPTVIPDNPLRAVATDNITPEKPTNIVPPSNYEIKLPTPVIPVAAADINGDPPDPRPHYPIGSLGKKNTGTTIPRKKDQARQPARCVLVTSHMVKSGDVGYHGNLFGGTMLGWLDEAAACLACQVCDSHRMVTLKIDQLIFKHPVKPGQIIKIYGAIENIGNTSITLRMEVRSHRVYDGLQKVVLSTKMSFVQIDLVGDPVQINDLVREKWGYKRMIDHG